jgi:hypothetical protein
VEAFPEPERGGDVVRSLTDEVGMREVAVGLERGPSPNEPVADAYEEVPEPEPEASAEPSRHTGRLAGRWWCGGFDSWEDSSAESRQAQPGDAGAEAEVPSLMGLEGRVPGPGFGSGEEGPLLSLEPEPAAASVVVVVPCSRALLKDQGPPELMGRP